MTTAVGTASNSPFGPNSIAPQAKAKITTT